MSQNPYIFCMDPVDVKHVETPNRRINTSIPAPGTKAIIESLDCVEARSMHGQMPIVWKRAENFHVFDIADNKLIDFTSTIFVANVGHSNPRVISSIEKSLNYPLLNCYAYAHKSKIDYISKLLNFCRHGYEKAFLLSSGTEATEAALKLMRMHGQRLHKDKKVIICFNGNWHGRTLGAQLLSSNLKQSSWIGYTDKSIRFLPFPYPWEVCEKTSVAFFAKCLELLLADGISLNRDVAGFMMETFQGWGALFYPKKFVQEIENLCRENNALLCFDEMQAGFGRTGKNFGFEHYEVTPDLICVGKGMGGGVPISGVIGRGAILDLPEVGNMSSTHSANPLCCGAALAVIEELLEKDLVDKAKENGKKFGLALRALSSQYPDRISYVSGMGMIWAILFKDPVSGYPDSWFASAVAEKCMQKGLLVVHTGRESIKIGPPLTITVEALMEGVDIISESIAELSIAR